MRKVQTSWPQWDTDKAPMPEGTWAMWQENLRTSHFMLCTDRSILWDLQSWVWESPTWFISSVSMTLSKQAVLLQE